MVEKIVYGYLVNFCFQKCKHYGGIMDNSKTEELVNGEWIEAKPLKYEPNLFERIVDKMPIFIQRWVYGRWG